MFAAVEQMPPDLEVAVRRRGDRGRIHAFREIFQRLGRSDPKLLCHLARLGLVGIEDRGELRLRQLRVKARVILSDVPNSDNADAELAHRAERAGVHSFCKNHS